MSWKEFSNTVHHHFMKKMNIDLDSREEAGFLGLELGGEVGELQNLIKKYWRDLPQPLGPLRDKIQEEIADVYIMLHHVAEYFEIDMEQVAFDKTMANFKRWPEIKYNATPDRKGTFIDD